MMLIQDVKRPRRSTFGSAGYDFFSPKEYELKPNEWTMIDTGVCLGEERVKVNVRHVGRKLFSRFKMWIRHEEYFIDQWFMMIAPRSGLSNKHGFRIRNTVGIIDQDYRDTIKILVTVDEPYTLAKGEKFAQGILLPYGVLEGEIAPTEARTGGHGSTGRF